jgi:hypothetical protein
MATEMRNFSLDLTRLDPGWNADIALILRISTDPRT